MWKIIKQLNYERPKNEYMSKRLQAYREQINQKRRAEKKENKVGTS
jgi:hypothetical protein